MRTAYKVSSAEEEEEEEGLLVDDYFIVSAGPLFLWYIYVVYIHIQFQQGKLVYNVLQPLAKALGEDW